MSHRKRDTAKARHWRRMISAQRGSGVSVRAFCSQQRLSEPSFYAWRRTLAQRKAVARRTRRRNPGAPGFVNLTPRGPAPLAAAMFQPAAPLELVHSCGHVLRIAASCDAQTLSMVLSALSSAHEEAERC